MIQALNNNISSNFRTNPNSLSEQIKNSKQPAQNGQLLQFPDIAQNLLIAGNGQPTQQRISITPRQFADIITESINKALQNVIGVLIDKIAAMFGGNATAEPLTNTANTEPANSPVNSHNIQDAVDSGSSVNGSSVSNNTTVKSKPKTDDDTKTSFLDQVTEGFNELKDFLLDPERGLISTIGTIIGTVSGLKLPTKLASKLKDIFINLMPKASKAFKNLWNKGTKLLKKIF